MIQYRLGRSLAQILRFYPQIKDKPIITTKILVLFAVIAAISLLFYWHGHE
jgi:hypothetical protein